MTAEKKTSSKSINEVLKKYENVLTIFLAGIVLNAVYSIVTAFVFHIDFFVSLKNFGTQTMGVVLPGIFFYVILFKRKQSLLGASAISYSLGYASNIISYFLLVPIGAQAIVPYFVILLAVVSVVIIAKKGRTVELETIKRTDYVFVLLFILFLILNIIAYAGANISPIITESAWYPTDIMFWVENTASLAREFPTTEPRVHLDYTLYYHYFSSIQLAYLNLATGIDCFTLSVPLFVLGKCVIFYGSFYLLFKEITKNNWIQLFGLIVVCFCSGFDGIDLTTYTSHTWTHPFGFDIGLAFGALFLYFFFLQWKSEKFDWRIFCLTIVTFACCVGLKAPVAVVVIIVAGIVCIWWLFTKKFVNAFSYGGALIVSFVLVALFCIGMFGGAGESSTGELSLSAVTKTYSFFSQIYPKFGAEWPEGLKSIVLAIAYCFTINPLVMGLFGLAVVGVIVDRKKTTPLNIGFALAGIFGLALGVFNVQPGHSQMYFSMSAIVPCLVLGMVWLNNRVVDAKKIEKKQLAVVFSCLLIVEVCFMFFQGATYWGNGLNSALNIGYKNMFQQDIAKQEKRNDGVQKEDLVALGWIRDNTAKDSVVLSDRSVMGSIPGYMCYGAFSERQMYLEGDIYYRERFTNERNAMRSNVQQVYQNSKEALQVCVQDGVDYVVQTKWLTPGFSPDNSILKLVFSSETINVYEVVK